MNKPFLPFIVIVTVTLTFLSPQCAFSESKYEQDKYWYSLSQGEKIAFLEGIKVGRSFAFFDSIDLICSLTKDRNLSEEEKRLIKTNADSSQMFNGLDFSVLVKIIDSLYKDPANIYIEVAEMMVVAKKKLAGDDFESELKRFRGKAMKMMKVLEEIEKKK